MTKIYGNYIPCDETVTSCGCDYVYCEHSQEVLRTYGTIYGSESKLRQIIQVFLDLQETSLERLCDLELPLKPLIQALGYSCCYYESSPEDCIDICGENYTPHTFSDECLEYEYDDSILLNILAISEFLNYPSRDNIESICNIFGWEVIYTTDYINILIGSDDPSIYKMIIDKIPVPIGEEIRMLTDC